MIKKIFKNKIVILFLVIIAGSLYYIFSSSGNKVAEMTYVIAKAEKGTIVDSISGTGQISALNEAVINSIVEGDILSLKVKAGDIVKDGQIIATIDSSDAREAISDAEDALESAELSLEKTKRGLRDEELEISQMGIENDKKAISDAEEDLEDAKEKAEEDLDDTYDTSITELKDAVSKALSAVYFITDMQSAHYNDNSQESIKLASAKAGVLKALIGLSDGGRANADLINKTKDGARGRVIAVELSKDKSEVDKLIVEMKDILSRIDDAIEIIPINDVLTSSEKSNITSQQAALDSKITVLTSRQDAVIKQIDTNSDNIRAAEKKIDNAKTTLIESEKQLALKTSIDPYDIQTQEMNIKQKKDALAEAKDRLNDYYITAPFSGVVAEVEAEQGNYVSKGGAIATVMTEKQVAEITLNEIDVTDVKVGQKATFTFDAIEDMTATGEVIEVGLIGNVSQGVVSYPVKILLNDSDDRIKAGMSTSVSIIVSAKQDVVMVPTSSIKASGGSSYVLTPANGESIDSSNLPESAIRLTSQPIQTTIEVGESSGEYSEILSGIDEGELIITKSVTSTATKTTSNQGQSLFNFGGGMRPQGATVRTTNSK